MCELTLSWRLLCALLCRLPTRAVAWRTLFAGTHLETGRRGRRRRKRRKEKRAWKQRKLINEVSIHVTASMYMYMYVVLQVFRIPSQKSALFYMLYGDNDAAEDEGTSEATMEIDSNTGQTTDGKSTFDVHGGEGGEGEGWGEEGEGWGGEWDVVDTGVEGRREEEGERKGGPMEAVAQATEEVSKQEEPSKKRVSASIHFFLIIVYTCIIIPTEHCCPSLLYSLLFDVCNLYQALSVLNAFLSSLFSLHSLPPVCVWPTERADAAAAQPVAGGVVSGRGSPRAPTEEAV